MNASLKNIAVVLVALSLVFLGYYFYSQTDSTSLSLGSSAVSADLFADVQKYEERRNQLNSIKLDTTIFTDQLFMSLTGYSREIPEQTTGRNNPFDSYIPSKTEINNF